MSEQANKLGKAGISWVSAAVALIPLALIVFFLLFLYK